MSYNIESDTFTGHELTYTNDVNSATNQEPKRKDKYIHIINGQEIRKELPDFSLNCVIYKDLWNGYKNIGTELFYSPTWELTPMQRYIIDLYK